MISDTSHDCARDELLRRIGPVRRARGYRLYTAGGRRILDLYQDGGRAILGHGGGGIVTAFKSGLERGPNSPLPSVYTGRLRVAVGDLIPECRVIRVFSNSERALSAISRWLSRRVLPADIHDPVWLVDGLSRQHDRSDGQRDHSPGAVRFWRPFLPTAHSPFARLPERWAILPILPTVGDSPPQVVLFSDSEPPESDIIARFRLAALVRGIYDLVSNTGRPELKLPAFTSVGPYLLPQPADRSYPDRFNVFLNHGFLTSPVESAPSIVPAQMSAGELAELRRAAAIAVQSESGDGN